VDVPLAPLASFDSEPVFGLAPLAVRFTNTSVGLVRSSTWDFGDGSTSDETSPEHVFAAPGRYTVALTVANETGANTLTRIDYVVATDVPPPAADFACDTTMGEAPLTVQFADASTGEVTSWLWDFGDGGTSTAPNPEHVYGAVGTFEVALTVTGPGGTATRARQALVTTTAPPPPEAAFEPSVTSGIDPLSVTFTDGSTGVVTSWQWSFGDGGSANEPSPTHVYPAAGLYTVSLTVTGPGGSAERVRTDLIEVVSVVRGLRDPSFEEQAGGSPPTGAWAVLAGGEHAVQPATPGGTDGPLPTEGAQWLRVSTAGSSFATPPSSPGTTTVPAVGGVGASQDFYLEDPLSVLAFDAAFVRGDALDPDWASIDVSDGQTTVNLFLADAATPAPETSLDLGLPRTAVQRVRASLRELFPASARNTRFTLTLQAGNGGEDTAPSYLVVDDFALEQALGTALRYGCDANVRGTLSVIAGEPRIATTITLGVDNPLGTQGANSRAHVWVSRQPDAAFPCGLLLPGFGMTGAGASGEILVDRTAGVLLKTTTGGLWTAPGAPARVNVTMPVAIGWIGLPLYVQGYLVDSREVFGVRTAVTDAFRLLLAP
jgi:PKD repeat protein